MIQRLAVSTVKSQRFVLLLIATAAWAAPFGCSTVAPNNSPTQQLANANASSTPAKGESCDVAEGYPGRSVDIASLPKPVPKIFPKSPADLRDRNFDPALNEWYGKFLRAVNQKSLLVDTDDEEDFETYRFIWLRSFHNPVIVQVSRTGRVFEMKSVESDGAGGYEPGKVIRTDRVSFEKEKWCQLVDLLNDSNFWSMPSIDEDLGGLDGARWIVEGVRGGRYHVVDRWSPQEGKFREAAIHMLKLSVRDTEAMGDDLY